MTQISKAPSAFLGYLKRVNQLNENTMSTQNSWIYTIAKVSEKDELIGYNLNEHSFFKEGEFEIARVNHMSLYEVKGSDKTVKYFRLILAAMTIQDMGNSSKAENEENINKFFSCKLLNNDQSFDSRITDCALITLPTGADFDFYTVGGIHIDFVDQPSELNIK